MTRLLASMITFGCLVACGGGRARPAAPASARTPGTGPDADRVALSVGPNLAILVSGLPAISPTFDELATAETEGGANLAIVVFDHAGSVVRRSELAVATAGDATAASRRQLDAQLARVNASLRHFRPMRPVAFAPATAGPGEELAPGTLTAERDGTRVRFDPAGPAYELSQSGGARSSDVPVNDDPESCSLVDPLVPRAWETSTDRGYVFAFSFELAGEACPQPGVGYRIVDLN